MTDIIPFDLNVSRTLAVQAFIDQAVSSVGYIDQSYQASLFIRQVENHDLTIEQAKLINLEL